MEMRHGMKAYERGGERVYYDDPEVTWWLLGVRYMLGCMVGSVGVWLDI